MCDGFSAGVNRSDAGGSVSGCGVNGLTVN